MTIGKNASVRPAPSGNPRRAPAASWRRVLALLGCVLLAVLCAPAARADAPSVEAAISDRTTEVGQAVEYRIEVQGGRALTRPRAPQVEGLTVAGSSQSTSIRLENFRMSESIVYSFTLLPTRAGTFTIPEQEIQVGGVALRTRALTLNVMPGGGSAGRGGGRRGGNAPDDAGGPLDRLIFAELIVPKKTAYVGETIPCEIRLHLSAKARLLEPDANPQLTGEGFSVQKFARPQIGLQSVEGVPFQVVTYKTAITAAKAGTLSIGPAQVVPTVQLPGRRPRLRSFGGFDDDVFDNFSNAIFFGAPQQVPTASDPVKIEIKPLPAAGQPANFSGAIGRFELGAPEVSPRLASAGDPLTVRVPVKGKGNFDRMGAPLLTDETGLRTYPANGKFKADDDVGLSGTKTFEQVVIPGAARDGLPGYRFSYFDPGEGKYVELQTPPIPLKIAPGAPLAAATPVPTSPPAEDAANPTPPPAATPAPAAQDILHIRTDPGTPVRELAEAFQPVWQQRLFWLAQGVAGAVLLSGAAWLLAGARRRDETARRRAALARERETLNRTLRDERASRRDFYAAAARLLELRDADRGALGRAEGAVAEGGALPLETIVRRHDELAYSGGPASAEPVAAPERQEVLAALAAAEASRPAAAAPSEPSLAAR